jgi:hypothetical protein
VYLVFEGHRQTSQVARLPLGDLALMTVFFLPAPARQV